MKRQVDIRAPLDRMSKTAGSINIRLVNDRTKPTTLNLDKMIII